jgi:hypothetical protein
LALAAIYEGSSRADAARIGRVTVQIVRDWVAKFNALAGRSDRPKGARGSSSAERRPSDRTGRDH